MSWVIIFSILISRGASQEPGPDFIVSVTATGDTLSYELFFGFSPFATDTFDTEFDAYAPPAPPPPNFDAALAWDGDRFYRQIVNGSNNDLIEHEWLIELSFPVTNTITVTWDNTNWSDIGEFYLTDVFDGMFGINVNMSETNSLTLDNPAFENLKLKITPEENAFLNRPPVADAGGDTTVTENTQFILDGSGSFDSNRDDLTFLWSSISNYVTLDMTTDTLLLGNVNQVVDTTDVIVTLTVNDGEDDSAPDTVVITIVPNTPPVANAGNATRIVRGDTLVVLNGSNSLDDTPYEALSYTWVPPAGIELSGSDQPTPSFIPPVPDFLTEYIFSLTVSDGEFESIPDTVIVTISDFSPPVPPTLYATSEHEKVILTWDNISENSIDSLTLYSDFEGYKLYRSTDFGETWGTRIYDYNGTFVGWEPIAQFDLFLEEDTSHCIYKNEFNNCDDYRGIDVSGLDPLAPRNHLGNNTGLQHSYVDSNVIDGIRYTYSLTAYDMGVRTFSLEYLFNDSLDVYTADTLWSLSNPDHYLDLGGIGKESLECSKGVNSSAPNFKSIIPGYFASNVTFPNTNEIDNFIKKEAATIGTGGKHYLIVDENDFIDNFLKFEIQADLIQGAFGGYATENPSLYIWEIQDTINLYPSKWGQSIDTTSVDPLGLDSLKGLPGAIVNNNVIDFPDYLIMDHKLSYADDGDFKDNWTDFVNGTIFKFDNMPQSYPEEGEDFEFIYKEDWYADSATISAIEFNLNFAQGSDYTNRPIFDYKIVFSHNTLDTALISVSNGCDDFPTITQFPFKITNLSTGKKVGLYHKDTGVGGTGSPTTSDPGYSDCQWTRNEELTFQLDNVLVADSILQERTYTLKIFFDIFSLFPNIANSPWVPEREYLKDDLVYYSGMVWKAEMDISPNKEPTAFIGDGTNTNPWEIQYPWDEGDSVIIHTKKFFVDGDSWVADMSNLGKPHKVIQEELKEIRVVPNPYIVQSRFESRQTSSNRIRFTNLPQRCRISVYTITGEKVTVIEHDEEYDGNEWWELVNSKNQLIAPGLYIYSVEAENLTHIGKFAIVR
ncbi:MAG: hypothetical protein QF795_01625 [Candidatus Marinimicrobia bacterium]|jgi:hypothetical protein|nr:hypothetical protein [Candidatus Neomarinimicrobiota bacterium]HJN68935.1 hypothetical protein [Candidatus Neomarinimicrobiota bacterium]|tara:strand:+ start:139 stop:3315 length:3177 start_codon:yes stop_codon:yes gene_type:complete